jgi:hypothetical protein
VHAANYSTYREEVEAEAERAHARYGLLLMPGLELTYDDPEPARAAHALALGLRRVIGLEDGFERGARAGCAPRSWRRTRTRRRSRRPRSGRLPASPPRPVVNRHEVFEWVARAQLPVVATGDFHHRDYLATW